MKSSKFHDKSNMQSNMYLWAITKAKFRTFCNHCTLHGAYYLSDNSRWWLRIIWVVIVCCSLGLCCFLCHMIWDKFIIDPTLTVVETTHYSTADIPFPAVTVCENEMVHGPNTENITKLLTLRGYNKSQIYEFYESFSDIQNKDFNPASYVKKMHYLLDDLGYSFKNLLNMFKKPCDEILLECSWRSRPHNCSDMFRSVYTVMGYCCQFDIHYFKKHVTTETNFIAGVQPTEALEIIVNGMKVSADGTVSDGFVSMYVFDQKDRVTLIDNAIILTPAAYFDVNVYLWAIDSSSYVKALSLLSRKCILETDPGIGTSFYQGCMTRLILKKVVNQCRCIPFEYTAEELDVEDYVACTWERLICVYQAVENVEADVREIISQNECYQRCDYVQYETEVEFIKNQRDLRDMEEINSKVTVHFSDTTCMKYRREVLYTWDQMLANLGGIFGLCLGGSIVSIMELIWFLFDLLFTILHESLTKRKIEPSTEANEKNNKNVFLVKPSIPEKVNKMFETAQKDRNYKKLGKSFGEVRLKFIN